MKTKINLLCIGVLVALALSASSMVSVVYQLTTNGIKAGIEAAETGVCPDLPNYEIICTLPTDLRAQTTSVENLKNGKQLALMPIVSLIEMDSEHNIGWTAFAELIIFVALTYALVQFFKLIRNINRRIIFDWQNVRRLRKLGCALIVSFLFYAIQVVVIARQCSELIELRGCELSASVFFSEQTLLLGIVSLLVAEIFTIGLKMKEEQELTI